MPLQRGDSGSVGNVEAVVEPASFPVFGLVLRSTTTLRTLSRHAFSIIADPQSMSGGSRSSVEGARRIAEDAQTLTEGARTSNGGSPCFSEGNLRIANGSRRMAEGSRRIAEASRRVAEGSRRVMEGSRSFARESSCTIGESFRRCTMLGASRVMLRLSPETLRH